MAGEEHEGREPEPEPEPGPGPEQPPPPRRRRPRRKRFDLGRILSTGFNIWWKTFVQLTLLSALVQIPYVLFVFAFKFAWFPVDPEDTTAWILVNLFLPLILTSVLQAAVIHGVVERLQDRPVSIGVCLSAAAGRFPHVFAISVIVAVGSVFGCCAAIVGMFLVQAVWWVAIPATVVEGKGVIGSLGRSAELTRTVRWPIVVILLAVTGIEVAAGFMLGMIEGVHSAMRGKPPDPVTWAGALAQILVGPIRAVMAAVGYTKLRELKEGTSVDELMKVFD